MRLAQLKYFIRVAELNNISKVASEYGVPSSVVSSQLKSLESDLDLPLFDRRGNSITINDAGRALLPHAVAITGAVQEATKKIHDHNGMLDYDLTISTMTLPTALPYILKEFRALYPQLKLQIVQYQHRKDSSATNSDITIYFSDHPVRKDNCRILYREPILLAVAADSELASTDVIPAAMLFGMKLILGSQYSDFRAIVDNYLSSLNVVPDTVLISDYPPFIRRLVTNHMGSTFMPLLTWYFSEHSTENIKLLHIREAECYRYIVLEWRNEGYISNAARLFADFVTKYLNELDIDENLFGLRSSRPALPEEISWS